MITKEQAEELFAGHYRYRVFYNKLIKTQPAYRTGKTIIDGDKFSILARIGCCKRIVIDNENAHEWTVNKEEAMK